MKYGENPAHFNGARGGRWMSDRSFLEEEVRLAVGLKSRLRGMGFRVVKPRKDSLPVVVKWRGVRGGAWFDNEGVDYEEDMGVSAPLRGRCFGVRVVKGG